METKTIKIRVSPQAAQAFETAEAEEQRRLEALLSLKLTETTRTGRSLEEIISDLSRKAQERGLTEEMLTSMRSR